MPDSEYNRLVRAIAKARKPAPPVTPPATPDDIAAIKLAQSRAATAEYTRKVLAALENTEN